MRGVGLGLCVAALCAAGWAAARPAWAGVHGEVVEYGEITAERDHPAADTSRDNTLTPKLSLEGIRHVNRTSDLQAQLCLRFGVSARLTSDDGKLPQEVTFVSRHPLLTRPDGVSSTEESFPVPVSGGMVFAGWTFAYPWEMQPGDWTMLFVSEGEVLASRTFRISVPARPGSLCPGKPMS